MRQILISVLTITSVASAANSGIIEFTDRPEWEAAIGSYTTIDFTGFAVGTVITTQYSDLGITFVDGFYDITGEDHVTYPNDGWGLDGNGDITVAFDEPQSWFASEFPGVLRFKLYRDDELVYTSSTVFGDVDEFLGVVFPETFDRVLLDGFGSAYIDDLLFGAPVPAPPAAALLGVALLAGRRRRRRG